MKTQKMYFWYICLFLAFSTSSQKNLNFQRYLERVQLLTRKFYDHWFSLLSWRWYRSLSKIQKKNKKNQFTKKKRKGKVEGLVWRPSKTSPINKHATVKKKGGEIYTGGEKRREFGGNKRKKTLNLNWFLSRRLPPSLGKNQKWPSPTFAKKNQKHRGAVPSSSGFLHGPAKAPHLTPSSEPQKRPDPSPPKKPNRPFLQPPAPLATTATKSQELPSLVFPHRPPHNSSSRQLPWPHLPKKSKPLPFSGLSPTRKTSQGHHKTEPFPHCPFQLHPTETGRRSFHLWTEHSGSLRCSSAAHHLGKPAVSPQQRRSKIQQTQLTEQQQPSSSSSSATDHKQRHKRLRLNWPPEASSTTIPPWSCRHLRRMRRRSSPSHQIHHRQKENKQRREKELEPDRSKKTKPIAVCAFSFCCRWPISSLPAGKGRGEEAVTAPCFPVDFRGGAWTHAPPLFIVTEDAQNSPALFPKLFL